MMLIPAPSVGASCIDADIVLNLLINVEI